MDRFPCIHLSLAAVLCVAAGGVAFAETFQVTNGNDSGAGSLRNAITQAEANGEADEIHLGVVTVSLASQLPYITTDITIIGQGWADSVIDGGNSPGGSDGVSAFFIETTGSLVLDGVNVTNCYAGAGGAVLAKGRLSVIDSRFTDNRVMVYGGAIFAGDGADVTLQDSSLTGNEARGAGAIALGSGSAVLEATGCTFSSNSTYGDDPVGWGAALGVVGGEATLTNCTFSGNHASQLGGGLYAEYLSSVVTLTTTTFAGNTAAVAGDDVYVETTLPTVTLSHTLIDDGCGFGSGGAIISAGFNLENGDTCGLVPGLGDLVNTDPQLGPLQANGGATDTHATAVTSPAVDGGDTSCGTSLDQRGMPRPVDGDLDLSAECDIGSVELQIIFWDGFESGNMSAWSANVP